MNKWYPQKNLLMRYRNQDFIYRRTRLGRIIRKLLLLCLKHLNLLYIYEDMIELDFFTENKWLIECKFHQEVLSEKQQALFDRFPAKEKLILSTRHYVARLLA